MISDLTIYIYKILPLVFSPLGLISGLLLAALCGKSRKRSVIGALVLFTFLSLPATSSWLWAPIEYSGAPSSIESIPSADAVVVLSGYFSLVEFEGSLLDVWGRPNRFFTGIDLMKARKASTLILLIDNVPWSSSVPNETQLKEKTIQLGVDEEELLFIGPVKNTEEEAYLVNKRLRGMDMKTIILVTSDRHMRRAKMIFDSYVSLNVIPFSVETKLPNENKVLFDFIPSASGFNESSAALREYLGLIFYFARAWFSEIYQSWERQNGAEPVL